MALLILAPPLNYDIPLMVNSLAWCYLVIVSGFFGMYLISRDLSPILKALSLFLFVSCFYSQAPYLSFNAYILIVASFYFFIGLQKCDFDIVINLLEAAFWFEVFLAIAQLMGKDTLMNLDRPEHVFLGTVMQYMRFSSVLACLTPFLIYKSRWYIVPIIILCILSSSSSFALAVIGGAGVYLLLEYGRKYWKWILGGIFSCGLAYAFYDHGSFETARSCGRLPIWGTIWYTWFHDTAKALPSNNTGPFVLNWFLFGHGIDTFLPMFPIYKHDPNPFPQAHNCWLQFLWELGITGFILISSYASWLAYRLFRNRDSVMLAGMTCIAINMFFAFPTRITQTVLLIVAFLALCEYRLSEDQTWRNYVSF